MNKEITRLDAIDLRRLSALSSPDRAFLTVYYSGNAGWEKERKRLMQDRAMLKSWPDELEHFDQKKWKCFDKGNKRKVTTYSCVCFRCAKPILIFSDILDGLAYNVFDHVIGNGVGAAHFAEQGNLVGRCSGLTGNANARRVVPGLQRFPEVEVNNLVRDAVAHLVWVAFRNTFTSEKKICWGQNNIRLLE